MKRKKEGFVLNEILVVIGIILVIAGISFRLINAVLNKAKVVTAKSQIATLAFILEEIKDDTGYYPVHLSDILRKDPPPMMGRNWKGPYLNKEEIPLDPWKHPYFYRIPSTTLFSSPQLPREYGIPQVYTFNFKAVPGQATIRVENYGVTACTCWLNGDKVLTENMFKKNPKPQIIEKEINLRENNELRIRVRSQPGEVLYISISGYVPTDQYFILGSYGKDGQEGGKGWNKDIIWVSNKYPNFQ